MNGGTVSKTKKLNDVTPEEWDKAHGVNKPDAHYRFVDPYDIAPESTSNGLTAKKGKIYPFGTISNSTTIFDNEAGYYPVIKTDKEGKPKFKLTKKEAEILVTIVEGLADQLVPTTGSKPVSLETFKEIIKPLAKKAKGGPVELDFSLPEGFAGGGMAGIRRPSAIPPESGPQPQGLASLKKYGSYY